MTYSKRQKNPLLKGQRPKNRALKTPSPLWVYALALKKTLRAGAIVIALGYVLFVVKIRHESLTTQWGKLWYSNPQNSSPDPSFQQPKDSDPLSLLNSTSDESIDIPATRKWQVSIISMKDSGDNHHKHGHQVAPKKEVADRIMAICHRFLRTAHRDELQFIADYLMRESVFDQVSLRRHGPAQILIEVSAPSPVALIHADTLRYVSENGSIFGQAPAHGSDEFTILSGIFDENTAYHLSAANKLIVGQSITLKVQVLLSTLKLAHEENLQVQSVHHHPYRGLHMILKNEAHITLGHPPLEKKFDRLKTILYQAEASQKAIQTIELDYKGKAFVKTKPATELSSM